MSTSAWWLEPPLRLRQGPGFRYELRKPEGLLVYGNRWRGDSRRPVYTHVFISSPRGVDYWWIEPVGNAENYDILCRRIEAEHDGSTFIAGGKLTRDHLVIECSVVGTDQLRELVARGFASPWSGPIVRRDFERARVLVTDENLELGPASALLDDYCMLDYAAA